MVNFKIYDVTNWTTNNSNTHSSNISRSKGNQATKFGQLINHSVRNIFPQKSCRFKNPTSSRPLFVFLKGFMQVVSTLVLIYFGRPRLGYKAKTNFITFQFVDSEIRSILFFYKKVWE